MLIRGGKDYFWKVSHRLAIGNTAVCFIDIGDFRKRLFCPLSKRKRKQRDEFIIPVDLRARGYCWGKRGLVANACFAKIVLALYRQLCMRREKKRVFGKERRREQKRTLSISDEKEPQTRLYRDTPRERGEKGEKQWPWGGKEWDKESEGMRE